MFLVDGDAKAGTIVGPHLPIAALEEFGEIRHAPLSQVVFHEHLTGERNHGVHVPRGCNWSGEVGNDPDLVGIADRHDLQHLRDPAHVRQRRAREVDVALLDERAELGPRSPFLPRRERDGGQQPQLRNLRAELLLTHRILDAERAVRLHQPADFDGFVEVELLVQVDHPVAVGTDAFPNLRDGLDDQADARARVENGVAGGPGQCSSAATPRARQDPAVDPVHTIAGRHRRGGALLQPHRRGFCRRHHTGRQA